MKNNIKKVTPIKKVLSHRQYADLKARNTLKLIAAVDEALENYGCSVLSVDKDERGMLGINICTSKFSNSYKSSIVCYGLCAINQLIDALNKRHVGYCF